jgi:hypothetical protein
LRATQNNFQLDGTLYTNRFFDSVPTMPNPDALQEFTIQSSNYSAEFGGASRQLLSHSGRYCQSHKWPALRRKTDSHQHV